MKVERPSETVDACDLCHRQKIYLKKCIVCGKDYCLSCEAIMSGCMHQPDVCEGCGREKNVIQVVVKYAKEISDTVSRRDEKLKNCCSEKIHDRHGDEL